MKVLKLNIRGDTDPWPAPVDALERVAADLANKYQKAAAVPGDSFMCLTKIVAQITIAARCT